MGPSLVLFGYIPFCYINITADNMHVTQKSLTQNEKKLSKTT